MGTYHQWCSTLISGRWQLGIRAMGNEEIGKKDVWAKTLGGKLFAKLRRRATELNFGRRQAQDVGRLEFWGW